MSDDKDLKKEEGSNTEHSSAENENKEQPPMHVHNPFTDKDMDVTQEDLDSIEKFKEAQTERD